MSLVGWFAFAAWLVASPGCAVEAMTAEAPTTPRARWAYHIDDGPPIPVACDASVGGLPYGLRIDPEGVDMLGRAYREAYIADQGIPLTGVTCDPSVPDLARGEVRVRDANGALVLTLTLECDPSVACGTI